MHKLPCLALPHLKQIFVARVLLPSLYYYLSYVFMCMCVCGGFSSFFFYFNQIIILTTHHSSEIYGDFMISSIWI